MIAFKFIFTKPVKESTEYSFPCLGVAGWNNSLEHITGNHRLRSVRRYIPLANCRNHIGVIDSLISWFIPADAWKTFFIIRNAIARGKYYKDSPLKYIAGDLVNECDDVLALLVEAAKKDIRFKIEIENTEQYPPRLDRFVQELIKEDETKGELFRLLFTMPEDNPDGEENDGLKDWD